MVNLYTLPTYVIVLFIGVILCLFLANSVLYYYLMPQAQFRQLGRKCLEGSSLLLLMAVATILYEVYTDSLNGIVYDEATDFWRYSTALAGTAGAVYWIHDRQAGSLWVLAASILLLPVFDDWLPGFFGPGPGLSGLAPDPTLSTDLQPVSATSDGPLHPDGRRLP